MIFRRNSCLRALISNPDQICLEGIQSDLEGKTGNLGNAYKCRRYVIDVTRLDPLSLGELGGGFQCFGEFGACGRARTMKIGRRVR